MSTPTVRYPEILERLPPDSTLILHEFRLDRADPLRRAPQQLGQKKRRTYQSGRPQYRRPTRARGGGRGDSVDEGSSEIDDGDRKKSLHKEKSNPRRCPVRRGERDQTKCPEKVRQRASGTAKVSGNGRHAVFFLKTGHANS